MKLWHRIFQPVVCLVLAIVLIGVPLWVLVVNAGKSQAEAAQLSLGVPTTWQLVENFNKVWISGGLGPAFFGSMLLLLPSVFIVLLAGSMAAWILARRRSRIAALLYAIGISGVVLPPAVVTLVLLLRQLGLAGQPIGMIATYVGMYLSTVIFFVTGFIRTIPDSLEESARIDGADPLRVFFTMILPLLRPVLATATILISLYVWNDVFYAFFVVGGRLDTLTLNLYTIASSGIALNNWNLIFAYVLFMSLPLVAIFVIFQKQIISGITSGAVK